ncbi:MAG: hypothetical protein HRU36_04645 [Rickettsiales bacterium]|nr:hypothetical protein [Rickettsiales bacterium]
MPSVIRQYFSLNDPITTQDKQTINLAAKKLLNNPEEPWIKEIFQPKVNTQYLESIAKELLLGCKHLVIIGTGASNNIPKTLFSLTTYDKNLQIYFLEDTDEFKFENVISKLDPASTRFLVISKSGRTLEILTLTLLCLKWIQKKIPMIRLNKIFYFVTSSKENNNHLLQIANKYKATIIEHPSLNGRFSFFSSVGLLPAAIAGLDLNLILRHASWCINTIFKESSWILDYATYFTTMSKKYHNAVLMTYSNIFHSIAIYSRQLISESLGKKGIGINPVIFEGNIDQHSQLQSYLDGLPDKFFTILMPAAYTTRHDHITITNTEISELTHLKNKTLLDINKLQIKSVINLLEKKAKNLRIIEVKKFNEVSLTEIIICFIIETILYAKLNKIDPFTQEAIETMKNTVTKIAI